MDDTHTKSKTLIHCQVVGGRRESRKVDGEMDG